MLDIAFLPEVWYLVKHLAFGPFYQSLCWLSKGLVNDDHFKCISIHMQQNYTTN